MPIRSLALLARLLAATSGDVWNATYLRGDGQPEVSTRFGARLSSRKVIDLDPNITTLARFAQTIYPNQNTWHLRGEGVDEEVFLAHVVYKNDAGSSLDDTSYLQAWTVEEGDGPWRQILKRSLSCPSVVITIPDRGPYVYEARPDVSPGDGQFHRECSCTAQRVENCLRAPQFLYIGTNVSAPPQESLHLTSASGLLPSSMFIYTAPYEADGDGPALVFVIIVELSCSTTAGSEFSPTTWSQDQIDATRNSICCDSRDTYLGNGPRISDLASAACRIAPVDSASPNSTRVFNKWVVVTDSFCDVTAQYKSLLLSNAHGMILLTNGTSSPATDYQVYAYSTEVSLMTMPLLVVNSTSTIAIELVENLKSGKTVQLTDEAILGITPGLDTVYSIEAGLRVYDTGKSSDQSDSAAHYKDVFNADPGGGLVMWMEHSECTVPKYSAPVFFTAREIPVYALRASLFLAGEIRPLLFVCIRDEGDSQKPEGRIHIYDTTNPMVDIRLVSWTHRHSAGASGVTPADSVRATLSDPPL
ncbi:hypothetical protein FOZ60_010715 [Perkinsus olseni]|uniref:Protein arginine methyltransferase 10 n=1 Tax=Perkinsus olseni TaxID=32597 RepID=A0A7J6PBP2_PEROL|nr:hypothetical protein FOZ60_010715 [Perkinsus olseni]